MALKGLFIGVDRYLDHRVPWLSGAVRDANALHALFTDTLGEGAAVLTDDAATAAAIRGALDDLRYTATAADLVVVMFAGHGTEQHHLVPYDARVDDLAASCIPLDEVGDVISEIPGETLVCVLDCCFSGGFGTYNRMLWTALKKKAAYLPG